MISEPDNSRPTNAVVARTLAASPPKTLADVASLYFKLLNSADAIGHEHALRNQLNGSIETALPIAEYQELWDVFRLPESPPSLELNAVSMLVLLPDRPAQAHLQELQKSVETWRATGPGAPPRAMAMEDTRVSVQPRVFLRRNPNNLGPVVAKRFLTALSRSGSKPHTDGSGRIELARAIVSPENPLTALVLVIRIWMQHFGSGLVKTPSDFGVRSESQTNPDLLDHLAYSFIYEDLNFPTNNERGVNGYATFS